jgi:beta-lactamase class A
MKKSFKLGMFLILAFPLVATAGFDKNTNIKLEKIESHYHGRLGISAINTKTGETINYRGNERFPMCSTWKLIVVSAVLHKSMSKPNYLEKIIHYKNSDIVSGYSPYTKKNLKTGMTIIELCKAAIFSDNTAANLLAKEIGGVQGLNRFSRSIDDKKFRLSRLEPYLNTAYPHDSRDTTTPKAMSKSIVELIFGNTLGKIQKKLLTTWLKDNPTGSHRISSGIPSNWVSGDKTGTCSYGTTNDIGIIYPSGSKPIILSVYFTQKNKNDTPKDSIIKKVTKLIVKDIL